MIKKSIKSPPSLKLWRTSIFSSFLIAVVFVNYLFFSLSCQASTQADIYNQMQNAGKKAWVEVPNGQNSLAGIIQIVISAFLGLLGIIFLVLIIYSGFNWMTAGGDEEKVTKAKQTLTQAVIGLIIIIAAYSITYFVFSILPGGGNPLGGS
jgi:hypothetical protein